MTTENRSARSWVGVDLDGTLAEYYGWVSAEQIGAPVPLMIQRVKAMLAEGVKVKIFTARISDGNPRHVEVIQAWCLQHIGQVLEVTNIKDFAMVELWDDRCIRVRINTGEIY